MDYYQVAIYHCDIWPYLLWPLGERSHCSYMRKYGKQILRFISDLDLESMAHIYYILYMNIFVNFKILNETSIITEFSTVYLHDKLL